ncbi:hypothetical protein ATANTOWER_019806 [Ataeniobius toweri]|uniref:Uncharacterized protein n=1 Tax=Ataeniobius toweri TaxID=208326 RepID=A0ABU7AH91_9TELE|nr:hypothetical protein [Ataeniobius toweri]
MHQPGNQPLQAKHNPHGLQCPTHLTANPSPAPGKGPEPQKEALEEGHHSTPRAGHPANSTPEPRRFPSMPITHTPARHTPLHQVGRLASLSTKAKPHPNRRRTLPPHQSPLPPQLTD